MKHHCVLYQVYTCTLHIQTFPDMKEDVCTSKDILKKRYRDLNVFRVQDFNLPPLKMFLFVGTIHMPTFMWLKEIIILS